MIGQSNSIFLSYPNEKDEQLDNDKFNAKIAELERRYDKIIIIKLSDDSSRFNQRYKDFVANNPSWGVVFYFWNSSDENAYYTKLSASDLSIKSMKLVFSMKNKIDENNLRENLKTGLLSDCSVKNSAKRYYFSLSKNPDVAACLSGELFDYLYDDINIITDEIDNSTSSYSKNNSLQYVQEDSLVSNIKELLSRMTKIGNRIDGFSNEMKALRNKMNEESALNVRIEPSFRFANNFSETTLRIFYHENDKRPHYFAFGLSEGELQGRTEIENYEYQNGSSIYSMTGVQEHSQTKFNGVSVGYKYIKDFGGETWELHIRGGVQFNRIASSKYHWSSGEMDVRGKLEGIGDEIINVPELGFQDNVKLAGVNGENEIRRFFGSLDADITLHYNLDKIDIFLGGGGIVSSKIQPRKTDALIFNGYQSNGLMSTVKPMALTKFYFTLGASIIF
jgi:hypothetical protein